MLCSFGTGPDSRWPASSHSLSALVLAAETASRAELQPAAAAPKLREATGGSGQVREERQGRGWDMTLILMIWYITV